MPVTIDTLKSAVSGRKYK